MRLLLDTHVILWWLSDSPRLSDVMRALIRSEENELYVSMVTLWEIRVKEALGKLAIPAEFRGDLAEQGILELSVSGEDTDVLATLPMHHRDPFDRLLIAQAIRNSLTIVTADSRISRYGVATVG